MYSRIKLGQAKLGQIKASHIKSLLTLSLALLTGWSLSLQADTYANAFTNMQSQQSDNIITVGVAPHGGSVVLGGSVIPLKEVTLAAQIPGRIISIAGEAGDEFPADTELVGIDDDDLQAKKSAAEAQLHVSANCDAKCASTV